MIKNILFDWGGVLLHLDKRRCVEQFAEYGVEVSDELTNPYGQRTDLKEFEQGLMSVEEFRDTVRRIYAPTLTDEQIVFAAYICNDRIVKFVTRHTDGTGGDDIA